MIVKRYGQKLAEALAFFLIMNENERPNAMTLTNEIEKLDQSGVLQSKPSQQPQPSQQ